MRKNQNQKPFSETQARSGVLGVLGSSIRAKLIAAMMAAVILPALAGDLLLGGGRGNQTGIVGGASRKNAESVANLFSQRLAENISLLETLAIAEEVRNQLRSVNQAYSGSEKEIRSGISAVDKQLNKAPRSSASRDPLIRQVTSEDPAINPSSALLRKFQKRFPQHVEVVLTNKYGATVAGTSASADYYRADEPWWQQAYQNGAGDVYLGKPASNPANGGTTIPLAAPVRGNGNEVLGVLYSALDTRLIADALGTIETGEASRAFIADAEGVLLFDRAKGANPDQKIPAALLDTGLLKKSGPGWLQSAAFDDQDSIIGYARPSQASGVPAVDKLGWTVVNVTASGEAVAMVASWQGIAFILVALALAAAAAVLIAGGMTGQLARLGELFQKLQAGDYRARAQVVSGDELGRMAAELNGALDGIFQLVQSRTEREELQSSVIKLLNDVSGVAEGDLTGEAEVRPDVTGAIADAFNHMTVELRRVIGQVQNVTQQVSSSATETRAEAERLAENSEKQAHQILNTREAIETITNSIRQVSEVAVESRNVANQSLETAKHGAEAVRATVRGMNSLREQVQQTSKRIKRLGENSQEIGEVVQLISEIAYRTSVLALNASIQAARAGESGRGFAVVAEEVEGLAKRSTDAAKRIAELVKTIQAGANEAIHAMEESTREVVQGSNLADQAGRSLVEIENVSNDLAAMIQNISLAAQQQASDSQAISRVMAEISEFTQHTASGIKQSSLSVNSLAELALDLRSSVASFKLPSNNGNNQYYARN